MKFFVVGDLHLTHSPPIRRKDNFVATEFDKLYSLWLLTIEEEPDYIFLLGDVFDSATQPLWFINRIIKEFKHFHKPIYSIIGNHDVLGRVANVHESALGTLFESVVKRLPLNSFFLDGIQFKGIDYTAKHSLDPYKIDGYTIIFSHNMITPSPFPYADHILASDVAKVMKQGVLFCGHYHTPFEYGTGEVRVLNPGVVVRTSIDEININPSIIMYDTSNNSYKRLPLKATRGVDVFNTEEYVGEKAKEFSLQTFINLIRSTQFETLDIESEVQRAGKELKAEDNVINEVIKRIRGAKATL